MALERARLVALVCSAVLLVLCGFEILDSARDFALSALVLVTSLASVGTLLGRVREGYGFALSAGVFASLDAAVLLANGRATHGVGFQAAVLIVGLALSWSGLALRRGMTDPPRDP